MRSLGRNSNEVWYDFYDDFLLVESSVAKQYGIRLRKEANTSSWGEVKSLVGGLMPDTPLGRIVSIRSEKNRDTLKNFTPEMNKIRNEWLRKQAKLKLDNTAKLDLEMNLLEKSMELLFKR